MDIASLLGPLLADVAGAAGLLNEAGELQAQWFENPLGQIEKVLTDTAQRAAILDLLDQIVPPVAVSGAAHGQKWHPLLGSHEHGNVYLVVDDSADPAIVVGLGGSYGAAGPSPAASVLFELPIARFSGSSYTALAGTRPAR